MPEPAQALRDTAYHGDPRRYDRTRGLPPAVKEAIVAALVARFAPAARVLDVGAGSGRFALPLAERGFPVVAVDLSPEMLAHLRTKRPADARFPQPVLADAARLPLQNAAFPAVFSVHALHLVPDLPAALDEIQRVLAPGGVFALGYIDHDPHAPVGWTLHAWRQALAERGYDLSAPMWRDYPEIVADLRDRLGPPQTVEAARWQKTVVPAEVLEGVSTRQFTPYWGLPDEEHAAVVAALRRKAQQVFGDLHRPRPDPRGFVWHFFTP